MIDSAGQAIGLRVPLPNSSSVQTCKPLAAEGLRPIPGGSVTVATRVFELSCSRSSARKSGSRWGTSTLTVAPAGELVAEPPGSTSTPGPYGMVLQLFGEVPCGIGDSKAGSALWGKT